MQALRPRRCGIHQGRPCFTTSALPNSTKNSKHQCMHQQPEAQLVRRREVLLQSSWLAPGAAFLASSTATLNDDPTTIINAVLSGYGLPMLKASQGFKLYDDFENDWYFQYPKSWVARPNSLRSGFYVSNFQTADKATVESIPLTDLPSDGAELEAELIRLAVTAAVVPGQGQADDKLMLPAQRLIKSEVQTLDGQKYIYLTFPSETVTRSGYAIKRRHWAVVAAKPGRNVAYTLSASARSDQYNKDKEALLKEIVNSFRVR